MRPDRDHIHAHVGTTAPLFSEASFVGVIERAEAFNGGSPFTLCRCPAMGEGDINFTGSLRQDLASGHWVPESGRAQLAVLAPANGRWFSVELSLAVDEGAVSHVQFRFDHSYAQADRVENTVGFLRNEARELAAIFLYAHDAFDLVVQDTTDPQRYQALTGTPPPKLPIDPRANPARTARAGTLVVTCRWLTLYGGSLLEAIGRDKVLGAPCSTEALSDEQVLLRLYTDPLAYSLPDNRQTHQLVRRHLGLDELIDSPPWEAVARRASEQEPPVDQEVDEKADTSMTETKADATRATPPLAIWAALYDAAVTGRDGEEAFYTAQARQSAGRVLELGCGTGRLTIPVARTGVPVVAVDPSKQVLDHLESLLQQEPEALRNRTQLVNRDLDDTDLTSYGSFAAIFIPYRGINRFVDPDRLRELLETLRASMQPGGGLVFNTFFPQPELMAPTGQSVRMLDFQGDDDEPGRYLVYDNIQTDPISQRFRVIRRFEQLDPAGRVTAQQILTLERRYYFPDELRYLLELSGFESDVQGGFAGGSLTQADQEVVLVARRL